MCNLERVGFMLFGAGLFLNILHGFSPWNHVLSAVGALVGSLVALLQMFVHAPPGTPPTGSAFFGLHMYSWAYVILTCAIFYSLFAIAAQASGGWIAARGDVQVRSAGAMLLCGFFVVLVGGNFVSAFLQNGFHPFKGGGQQHYQLLYDGDVMKP
jgi:hypothetical protein